MDDGWILLPHACTQVPPKSGLQLEQDVSINARSCHGADKVPAAGHFELACVVCALVVHAKEDTAYGVC